MDKISEEDLLALRSALEKKNNAQNVAKLSARIVELEHENAILRTYIKYGLQFGDTISDDGVITKQEKEPVNE